MDFYFFTTRYIGDGNLFDTTCEQFVSNELYVFYKENKLFVKLEDVIADSKNNDLINNLVNKSVSSYFMNSTASDDSESVVYEMKRQQPTISTMLENYSIDGLTSILSLFGDDAWRKFYQLLRDDAQKALFIKGYSKIVADRLRDKAQLSSWLVYGPDKISISTDDLKTLEKKVYSPLITVHTFENNECIFCAIKCLTKSADAKVWCMLLKNISQEIACDKKTQVKSLSLILHDKDVTEKKYHQTFCVAKKEDIDPSDDGCFKEICFYMHTNSPITKLLTEPNNRNKDIADELTLSISSYFWKEYLVSLLENVPQIKAGKYAGHINKPDLTIHFKSMRSVSDIFKESFETLYPTLNNSEENPSYEIAWLKTLPDLLLVTFLRNSIAELK